jgi:hemerythrin
VKELIWDNTLSVQIQEIDDDHHKLVNLFNILSHAVEDDDASDYIDAVFDELIHCTVWHFKHEERLMLKYAYDGAQAHKSEHDELIDSAKSLQKKLQQEGGKISNDDIKFLEHWLTGHIFSTDMDLGNFLGEVM